MVLLIFIIFHSILYDILVSFNNLLILNIDVTGFITKNNFSLQEDLVELMSITTNSVFATMISSSSLITSPPLSKSNHSDSSLQLDKNKKARKRAGAISLTSQFREQLDSFITSLKATQPHYIKVHNAPCIYCNFILLIFCILVLY